jgi:hypothetical protein
MSRKMISTAGMLGVVTAGGIITCVPASAQVPVDGSHSRNGFFDHHRNKNWSGNDNSDLNHTRLRIRNRNNDIAVARAKRHQERPEVPAAAAAAAAAAPCIAAETAPGESGRKWVAVTRNGQVLVALVDTSGPLMILPFAPVTVFDVTPACVALSNTGNRLQITVIGTNGQVQESECPITGNTPATQPPASCQQPINIPFSNSVSAASATNRRADATPDSARRAFIRPQAMRGDRPVRQGRTF